MSHKFSGAAGAVLSGRVSVMSPEGVLMHASPASIGRRMAALALDGFVLVMGNIFLIFVLYWGLSKAGVGIYMLASFLLTWGYFFLFEAFMGGRTPGKYVMRISVVNVDLTPLTAGRALWRNVLRAVDLLPGCFAVGAIAVLLLPHGQRLGDYIAGTLVIAGAQPQPPAEPVDAEPELPPWPLDYDDKQILLSYARYAQTVNPERAAEMAEPFVPLLPDMDGQARAQLLMRYAAWFDNQAGKT